MKNQTIETRKTATAHPQGQSVFNTFKASLSLGELRKAKRKSQQEIASLLNVKQAEISKMERRTDMYVSTLYNFVQAMGGRLEIIARFPDAEAIRISQFDLLDSEPTVNEVLAQVEDSVMRGCNRTCDMRIGANWQIGSKNDLNSDSFPNFAPMNFGVQSIKHHAAEDWFQKMVQQCEVLV